MFYDHISSFVHAFCISFRRKSMNFLEALVAKRAEGKESVIVESFVKKNTA